MNTIIDYFNRTVSDNPHKTALVFQDRRYSYSEIELLSRHIAGKLIALGVRKGDTVGILIDRSEFTLLFPLSVLRAGAVFLPIDESFPPERIGMICRSSNVKYILTEDYYATQIISTFDGSFINYTTGDLYEVLLDVGKQVILPSISSEDAMVIFYTSGTTGNPKGVIQTHKTALVSNLFECSRYKLSKDDIFLSYVSYYYGFGLRMFQPLILGATLHILSSQLRGDMELINKYIIENDITVTSLPTPVGYQFYLFSGETSLRLLTVAGGVLPPIDKSRSYSIVSEYGCTEYIGASFVNVKSSKEYSLLGYPADHTTFILLDSNGRPSSDGIPGELYISGECMARGYVGNPELDATKFLELNGRRVYRTGDMAVKEGLCYRYLGRVDRMVKLNGHRIELDEVESQILKSGFARLVYVCVKKLSGRDKICAYVVFEDGFGDIQPRLIEYLQTKIPDYMIPSVIVKMESMPLSSHGKIDERNLPEPIIYPAGVTTDQYLGLTDRQTIVMSCFKEVLHIRTPFSIDEHFWNLGGDSLMAMSLITLLREHGLEISLQQIKSGQTVRSIAAQCKPAKEMHHKIKIENVSVPNTYMVASVLRYNDIQAINHYVIPELLFCKDRVDCDIVRESLQMLVATHEMLRALVINGELFIRGENDPFLFDFDEIFIYKPDNNSCLKQIEQEIQKQYFKFDVFTGSMMRARLFHTPEHDYVFLGYNHLVTDDVSKRILREDFCRIYSHLSEGKKVSIPETSTSYIEYAKHLAEYYADSKNSEEFIYWQDIRDRLHDGLLSKIVINHTYLSIVCGLSEDDTRLLYNSNASMEHLLLLALARVRGNASEPLAVQLVYHGRDEYSCLNKQYSLSHFERTVGYFPMCYPIILDDLPSSTKEALSRVRHIMASVPNSGTGFGASGGYCSDEVPFFSLDYLGADYSFETRDSVFARAEGISRGQYYSEHLFPGSPFFLFSYPSNGHLMIKAVYDSDMITNIHASGLCHKILDNLSSMIRELSDED